MANFRVDAEYLKEKILTALGSYETTTVIIDPTIWKDVFDNDDRLSIRNACSDRDIPIILGSPV